jgi:2-polyprenyl-3-methyl-5-hydroxy-6-metoxy-1,4-benzoquinol methylase
MDQTKVDAFAERIFGEVVAAMAVLNLYLGHRLGLFAALAGGGPATPAELASCSGCAERYVREWLECMAVQDYVTHDPATGRFALPREHAAVLVDRDHPSYAVAFACFLPSFGAVVPQLVQAFRTGGGVPYEAYGADTLEAIAFGNRPMFVHDYAARWLPALPDVVARLEAGGRVAEVGCGLGWSSIALARAFPKTRIDAVDVDEASIADARRHAAESGVADRIVFHRAAAEDAPVHGPYDLVTAFECLHDMPYPVRALRRMRELASPGGAVLIADEAVGDSLDENRNFVGRLNYNFSVLHCLPQALVFPGAAGTGTVIRPSTVRRYAEEAGFSRVETLPIDNPLGRFYRLTP